MGTTGQTPAELQCSAEARVADVAKKLGATLIDLATALHAEIAEAVPDLRGDDVILELLRAGTESNVETFLHMLQHGIAAEELLPPSAAVEYTRRMAQRGISSNALLRAYRIAQNRVLDLGVTEIARQEPDREVAIAATQILQRSVFAFVEHVAEQIVAEYESERERWLANRNTVRAATLATVLSGRDMEVGAAESALGYRLRQHHLGVVVWCAEREGASSGLRRLASLVGEIGECVSAVGQSLFMPQDSNLAWAWLPLGRSSSDIAADTKAITALISQAADVGARVALGRPHAGVGGFRNSHEEAIRAHTVAATAHDRALPVTTFDDPGVQVSSILAQDLDATRRLVTSALGGLAIDDEGNERLRETLLAFIATGRSYIATAEVVHLHRNTVKYRVDKAAEVRGRSIDEDRLSLELALTACRWLGAAVLSRNPEGQARA